MGPAIYVVLPVEESEFSAPAGVHHDPAAAQAQVEQMLAAGGPELDGVHVQCWEAPPGGGAYRLVCAVEYLRGHGASHDVVDGPGPNTRRCMAHGKPDPTGICGWAHAQTGKLGPG